MSALREALVKRLGSLPILTHDNGYPVQALPKSELLDLLAAHPERPENEVKAEALREMVALLDEETAKFKDSAEHAWVDGMERAALLVHRRAAQLGGAS